MIDVTKEIRIHAVIEEREGLHFLTAHTHGLEKFGHKELFVGGLDSKSAAYLLNSLANYIINYRKTIRPGENILFGDLILKASTGPDGTLLIRYSADDVEICEETVYCKICQKEERVTACKFKKT